MGEFVKIVQFDTLRSIAFGSIGASYTAVGTPLYAPCRKFKIWNATDQNVLFSDDGVNDKDFIPSNGFVLWDLIDSSSDNQQRPNMPIGRSFYIKESGTGPSQGAVYITVVYAS